MYSEEEIINGCVNKNKLFEDLLYNRFASITYAICLRYVADVDDAKDVFQEAFVKVYTQLKNYKNEGSFDGWVKRIFVNSALDYCRKNRKISFTSVTENEQYIDETFEEQDVDVPKEILLNLIRNLPDGYRVVFNMYAIEKYSHKQIAETLNIEEGTSKSQLFKARKILQTQVKQLLQKQEK